MPRPLHTAPAGHTLRRIARLGALLCLAAALLSLLSTCSGEVRLFDPAETPPDTIPSGVQKADLILTVQVDPQDEGVSEALGWAQRAVPEAEVTLSRIRSTEELTGVTGDAGRVRFERLLPGDYRASAVRLLTEAERGRLVAPDEDVNALGGGTIFTVEAPATEASLELAAGRPRSLVISEWSVESGMSSPGTWYDFGDFLELYNNTDTTIYLDGKLIGAGVRGAWDYPNWPCSAYDRFRTPDGVWIYYLYQFPGSGRQYPLPPGQPVVIATDAIDHGQYAEGMPDLSDADFEFIGSADVDNPRVPNLVSVGPREYFLGHGLLYIDLDDIAVLADSVDLDALPKDFTPGGLEVWQIPAAKVLDVVTWRTTRQGSFLPCPRMVHERFDRQEARILDPCRSYPCEPRSGQRRVLLVQPDGRQVLQHTLTSARDFFARPRTPGLLP